MLTSYVQLQQGKILIILYFLNSAGPTAVVASLLEAGEGSHPGHRLPSHSSFMAASPSSIHPSSTVSEVGGRPWSARAHPFLPWRLDCWSEWGESSFLSSSPSSSSTPLSTYTVISSYLFNGCFLSVLLQCLFGLWKIFILSLYFGVFLF